MPAIARARLRGEPGDAGAGGDRRLGRHPARERRGRARHAGSDDLRHDRIDRGGVAAAAGIRLDAPAAARRHDSGARHHRGVHRGAPRLRQSAHPRAGVRLEPHRQRHRLLDPLLRRPLPGSRALDAGVGRAARGSGDPARPHDDAGRVTSCSRRCRFPGSSRSRCSAWSASSWAAAACCACTRCSRAPAASCRSSARSSGAAIDRVLRAWRWTRRRIVVLGGACRRGRVRASRACGSRTTSRRCSSRPRSSSREEQRVRELLGSGVETRFFLVSGDSAQAVLETEERLTRALDAIGARGRYRFLSGGRHRPAVARASARNHELLARAGLRAGRVARSGDDARSASSRRPSSGVARNSKPRTRR